MAPQAIADPAKIEQFARQLKAYNDGLKQSASQINAQFRQLGELWRDQEHRKFAQEFAQTMRVIQRFLQSSERHIPFLQKKAQRLWEYLRQG